MNRVFVLVFAALFVITLKVSADQSACCPNKECKNIVCQPCNNQTICPECFVNGTRQDYLVPCCQQLAHLSALTAAAIEGAAIAFAAAEASASASAKVIISAGSTVTVGASAAIAQAVALSKNSGKCCEISADVAANASVYSLAVAQAAAEAKAAAETSANAQAAAQAAASAAAQMLAQAQTIIQSSCCGFNLEVYSAVEVAGSYVTNAQACVEVLANVAANAQETAEASSYTAAVAKAGTSSIVGAKLDNCCVKSRTTTIANATASSCLTLVNKARVLHATTALAYQKIKGYAKNVDAIATAVVLVDSICLSECGKVQLTCCSSKPTDGCCDNTEKTCCTASQAIADVYLATSAVAETVVSSAAFALAHVYVYAEAITRAAVAADVASKASVLINVEVTECCNILVTVETIGLANGTGVAEAHASASAAASAFAASYANAQAISMAVMEATAKANAAVIAYNNGCCGKSCCSQVNYNVKGAAYDCCALSFYAMSSYQHSYYKLATQAREKAENLAKESDKAKNSTSASQYIQFSNGIAHREEYGYRCCCCNIKTTTPSSIKHSMFGYDRDNSDQSYKHNKFDNSDRKTNDDSNRKNGDSDRKKDDNFDFLNFDDSGSNDSRDSGSDSNDSNDSNDSKDHGSDSNDSKDGGSDSNSNNSSNESDYRSKETSSRTYIPYRRNHKPRFGHRYDRPRWY